MLLSAGLLKEPPWKTAPLLYDEQEQDNKGLECTSIIILSSGPNHVKLCLRASCFAFFGTAKATAGGQTTARKTFWKL